MTSRPHTVLACPLDWGLGHASRMIPVIRTFIEKGSNVILGGSGRSADLLRSTFPDNPFVPVPSPVIRYGEGRFPAFILFHAPGMLFTAFREHRKIAKLVEQYSVDIIISDNRYGLFCSSAYSIFITHQISPVLPVYLRWLEYPLYRLIRYIIGFYDECWIPDFNDSCNNLSGNLSHRFPLPSNARFVGLLSRFMKSGKDLDPSPAFNFDRMIVLSGPEPQVSIFEKITYKQASKLKERTLIVNGMRGNSVPPWSVDNTEIVVMPHLPPDEFRQAMLGAGNIICRSGYTSIMDLVALNRSAMLIPTPGQTEQEYLAGYLGTRGWFQWMSQKIFSAGKMKSIVRSIQPHFPFELTDGLGKQVERVILYKKNKDYRKISYKETDVNLVGIVGIQTETGEGNKTTRKN